MPTEPIRPIETRSETQRDKVYLVGDWPQRVGFTPQFLGLAEHTLVEAVITYKLENGTARYLIVDWRDGVLIAERLHDAAD